EQTGRRRNGAEEVKDRKIAALEGKRQQKNEVLAELMQAHVQLKKERGEPGKASGCPTTPATRSWTSSPAGPARPASPSSPSGSGSGWPRASGTMGRVGTARPTSTTPGCPATTG